jgi:hypothetical protein
MKRSKATIWTEAATTSPVLARLDKKAPLIQKVIAKKRAAQLRERIKRDLVPFTRRSISNALGRKDPVRRSMLVSTTLGWKLTGH